ncbi:uncharacterized protein LOC141713983 [Apium graveolens]|uniref:uncharacterized protein LOC141713983 n=1 Tax=Apium graveolens TaxID=4045 RepID=UPI003D7ABCDB
MLDKHNRLVKGFRMARGRIEHNAVDEFRLVLIASSSTSGRPNHIGPSNEVVGLIVTDDYAKGCRDTIIHSRTNELERIYETDPRFMQVQYPLLFPHGNIGFYRQIPANRPYKKQPKHSSLTPHLGGRLWHQYVVDAFTAMEQYKLDWIRDNQTTIRSDLYQNIRDALQKGDSNPENVGKARILPASFTGSKRCMNQYFKDALAICRTLGHPSLILTMTTNTKWPEIQRMLKFLHVVDVFDAPDVVARVLKMKVDQMVYQIKNKNCFGRLMHIIEFQKHGLPHAHMLIWLHPNDCPKTTDQIDKMVSAEIPHPSIDPVGYEPVKNYMIHGPCGTDCVNSPCMAKGSCTKHFPKRKTGITVNKKGIELDNRYVVPYNRDLLIRFQCHTNLEICNSSRSLKYLFKYCLKGHDTVTMCLKKKTTAKTVTITPITLEKRLIDEVKHYLDGRYVCASEASWRIFGFDIHSRWPSVERLPIHLPNDKHVSFRNSQNLQETVHGHIYKSFHEACAALGLLQNDQQWQAENSHTSMPPQLRAMFVNIVVYSPISHPRSLWDTHWGCMSDDIILVRRHLTNNPNLCLIDYDIQNYALAD